MRTFLVLGLSFGLLQTGWLWLVFHRVWAQQVLPGEMASQVRELVSELNHPELARREAAEKKLVELGPDVLALLPPVDNRLPSEVRQRLLRIVNTLQLQHARQTFDSTRVTFQGRKPVSEMLAIVTNQTGNEFAPVPDGARLVEVHWDRVPFWQAVDELLDAADLTTDLTATVPRRLTLLSRPHDWPSLREHSVYVGPCRLRPVRLTAVRDIHYPRASHLRLTLELLWEPRLSPVAVWYDMADIVASDDQGRSLVDPDRKGQPEIPVHPRMTGIQWELPLRLPDRSAGYLSIVRGKLTMLVPSRHEEFVFQGDWTLSKPVAQRKAAVTVVLDDVRKYGSAHVVRLRVRFDESAGALESHRGWPFQNEAFLLDTKGTRVEPMAMETTRQAESELGVAYTFERPERLDGCKFIYRTPVLLWRHELEFALQNLPLP